MRSASPDGPIALDVARAQRAKVEQQIPGPAPARPWSLALARTRPPISGSIRTPRSGRRPPPRRPRRTPQPAGKGPTRGPSGPRETRGKAKAADEKAKAPRPRPRTKGRTTRPPEGQGSSPRGPGTVRPPPRRQGGRRRPARWVDRRGRGVGRADLRRGPGPGLVRAVRPKRRGDCVAPGTADQGRGEASRSASWPNRPAATPAPPWVRPLLEKADPVRRKAQDRLSRPTRTGRPYRRKASWTRPRTSPRTPPGSPTP